MYSFGYTSYQTEIKTGPRETIRRQWLWERLLLPKTNIQMAALQNRVNAQYSTRIQRQILLGRFNERLYNTDLLIFRNTL